MAWSRPEIGRPRLLAPNRMNSLDIIPYPDERLGLLGRMPLTTSRLRIREFQLADARHLFALHRDPRATRYAGGTRTKKKSFESLCRIINGVRRTGFGAFAIELMGQDGIIGWAGIQLMPNSTRYELFYALRANYWGNGYATEAGAVLLNSVFNSVQSPLPEIFALVFPQNIESIRVLEKLGMSLLEYYFDETTQRHACLYHVSREHFVTLPGSAS